MAETSTRRSRRNADAQITVSVPRGKTATALTAAASRVGALPAPVSSQGMRAPQWQLDSLAYYDQIGPVRYAAQFWARGLSKIRFFAAEVDENGEIVETDDPDAIEAFERVQDPMGGRVGITSTYGQLRFLTGECYLIWTPELTDPETGTTEPEKWEVVSMLELRKLSKRGGKETWHRISAPGLNPQELVEADDDVFEPMANEVIVYRLWKRHPAYSMMADAPMRSVLAECEEIVRCTHTINARLISRLAGPGIFAIPMSWKVKPLTDVAKSDNPDEDPFQVRLTRAMIAAIGTPGSAESVSPIVVRVPDESLAGAAGAKLYKIWDPNETIRELDTREKAIHRFAVGVDMPPGKVEGIEGSTHWNAWAIDKEGVEHLLPVALDFANDLASAYLRPTLRDSYDREDWDRFVVGVDAAAAVTNPDELKDALELYNNRIVGKAYVRGAGNATDDDAMTDEELAEALFVATRQVVDVAAGAIVPGEPVDEAPLGDDTEQDMPEEPDAGDVEDEAEAIAASANGRHELTGETLMVMAQAELALEEVRASIGRRVYKHLAGGRCTECAERVKATPAHLIVAELGEMVIAEQEIDLKALAENAGSAFGFVLERKGVTSTQARAVQEVLERHAVATIYDTVPGLPAGFTGRVRALEAA